MLAQKYADYYTVEDYQHWEGDWELIYGFPSKKPKLIFEIVSPSTVRRDETLKFELYQNEGVAYYTIVYPKKKIAKVYRLKDGRYIKVDDFSDEIYNFDMKECSIDFDFSKIWRVRQ